MELVYFLISVIEIILTVILAINLHKAYLKLNEAQNEFEFNFSSFCLEFKKLKQILSITSLVSKKSKMFLDKTKDLRKFLKAYKKIITIISTFNFLFGTKKKKGFNIFSLFRLVLFGF